MSVNNPRRNLILFLVGMLTAARFSWCSAAEPVTIIVDESKIIRKIPRELFGFNHNWIHSERLVWDKQQNQISPEFVDTLSGLPMPLNRMAGSVSQIFHWKEAIGPVEDRIAQQLAPHDLKGKKYFGPLEWIESTRKIDPKAEFSWVFNMKTESPSDHADLVEFLIGDGKTNFNGGINWAEKRIQFGINYPVNVSIWELGNEFDRGGLGKSTVEQYIEQSKRIIHAIRSIDPDAKIAAHATTAPWSKTKYIARDWKQWHRKVLRELGPQIDYIAFHPYYLGVSTARIEKFIDVIRDDIGRITGQHRIKIFISEHAVWPSTPFFSTTKWRDSWYQTHSLSGVLGTAQFLNRLICKQEVVAATYNCFTGGPWALFYHNKASGGLYTTGIYELYKVFGGLHGKLLLDASVSGKDCSVSSNNLKFTVSVVKTNRGVKILAVNRDKYSSRDAFFNFNKKYNLKSILTLTGDSMESYNSGYENNIYTTYEDVEDNGEFYYFNIKAKSIVVLSLDEI